MTRQVAPGDLDAIVFDFDGVLTDNFVYVDGAGNETVRCTRADGLAFDVLRKLPVKLFILSTERNPVVTVRAQKLGVTVLNALADKRATLISLAARESFDLERTLFVGNDLNDLASMQACGWSACPSDSHRTVRAASTFVLETAGGHGVVRELLERVFQVDMLAILQGQSEA